MVSKKRWAIAIVLTIVAIIALKTYSRIDHVHVGVIYDRPWQGAIGGTGSVNSWGAQGSYEQPLKRPGGVTMWIVSANAQKMDGSTDELTIMICYENNNGELVLLAEARTSQPYGAAQVSYVIK